MEERQTIAVLNRKRTKPESAAGAVLARLEWFDRPEFAPSEDRAQRLEPRHARVHASGPARRRRVVSARLARRLAKAVVVLGVSAAVVAGVSVFRLRGDTTAAPHDPVTLGLHRSAHASAARPRIARRPAPAPAHRATPKRKPAPKLTPAAAARPAPKRAAAPSAKRTPKPASKAPPAVAISPVSLPAFTWTPLVTATGYEFQLFRGSDLVFLARTPKPSITLPPAWTFKGRLVRVTPGTYRWYVWPLAGDRRGDTAVVQAKLTVG